MKKIRLSLLIFLFSLSFCSFAQNKLTESEKQAIQVRVKQKVDEFQAYLTNIANIKLTTTQRQNSIKSALALFIGKGERYSYVDENGDRVNGGPVKMQLSSLRTSVKNTLTMSKYLQNTYNNVHRYGRVVITAADMVRIDELHQTGDGTYETMAYIVQKYIAFRDNRVVYSDITTKKIKVYVKALPIPGGVIWDAKLGDVYVDSTNPTGD